MLISRGSLNRQSLFQEVVIVTGAGGGIGLEAARALLWLGARVVIAEIDSALGQAAVSALADEVRSGDNLMFVATDVGSETSVEALIQEVEKRFGRIDAVINNATFSPAGTAVVDTDVDSWDRSYAVNLRGPALLARKCVPGMLARRHGAFVCVSSTGGPFLAAYETLKAAQLALANSLDAELANTGVVAFTIGPGLVPTKTALAAIEKLAPKLGVSVGEFWQANRGAVVSVEAAGAGFAAAIALAQQYAGQEISSTQALIDAGIRVPDEESAPAPRPAPLTDAAAALRACRRVRETLAGQVSGWKERSFFERQWMVRDFKQRVGLPVERCLEMLGGLDARLVAGDGAVGPADRATLTKLGAFYKHLGDLARGYVKDAKARDEQAKIITGWVSEVDSLLIAVD